MAGGVVDSEGRRRAEKISTLSIVFLRFVRVYLIPSMTSPEGWGHESLDRVQWHLISAALVQVRLEANQLILYAGVALVS